MRPLELAAADYLNAGLSVIALSGKAPNSAIHRHGLREALTGTVEEPEDWATIIRVFRNRETTGVGIVIQAPYVVVDIDGEDGAAQLRDLIGSAELDDTPIARTSRGLHVWYAIAGPPQRTAKLGSKLDLKGVGGYVCRTGEARTLMANRQWRAIGDLRVGDQLLAFSEQREGTDHLRGGVRQWRESTVLAHSWRRAETVRVVMASGREMLATLDHPFLASRSGRDGGAVWMRADQLMAGRSDRKSLTQMPRFTEPWEQLADFESGWFAGLLDGEGWTDGYSVALAQKEGLVQERARRWLRAHGWRWREDERHGVIHSHLLGTSSDVMRLLGQLGTSRLTVPPPGQLWARSRYDHAGHVPVVAVEPAGVRDVVVLTTSTGTFIDEGYGSHNCAPPSVHPSGHVYEWLIPLAPSGVLRPPLELPDGVAGALARQRELTSQVAAEKSVHPSGSLDALLRHVRHLEEGNRNNGLHWAAATARDDGYTLTDAGERLMDAAVIAGLDAREAWTTIRSAFRGAR